MALTDTTFAIDAPNGDLRVEFKVTKLMPMPAYRLFEELRVGLSDAFSEAATIPAGFDPTDLEEDSESLRAGLQFMLTALPRIPAETVERLRVAVFQEIRFTRSNIPTPTTLAGNETTAFAGLDAVHVYEVLVRGTAVSFLGSWAAVESLIPSGLIGSR